MGAYHSGGSDQTSLVSPSRNTRMVQLHLHPSRAPESVSDYHSLSALADKFLSQGKTKKPGVQAEAICASILEHGDPLGDAYARIIAPDIRRQYGATFTPPSVVQFMLNWAKSHCRKFSRIIDPGAGSGRFALAAARLFPESEIIAVEKEPYIAHLLKANVAAAGLRDRIRVIVQDYRTLELPKISAPTLFVGNPPYVRHHHLGASWKRWYAEGLKAYNVAGSRLAGLHLHFLLKTRQLAEPGDYGCFITAAEWLDVNYGSPLRAMLTNGMGGQALYLVDKTLKVFGDALTSSVILCFRVGATPNTLTMRHIRSLEELSDLGGGRKISLCRVQTSRKWSQLTRRRNGKEQKPSNLETYLKCIAVKSPE